MKLRSLPNLIIAGANRSGTTSLYTYLCCHPEICGSSIKETNFFMPLCYGNPIPKTEQYASYFIHCRRSHRYLLEASPRYLFGGHKIAHAISETLDKPKIIFLLRNPSHRLYSYYKQQKASNNIPETESFNDYVQRAITEYETNRFDLEEVIDVYSVSVYLRGLAQGIYSFYLEPWVQTFKDSVKILNFEDLKKDPFTFMEGLCNWLEIDSAIYSSMSFESENRSIYYRSKLLHLMAESINTHFEKSLRRHPNFKILIRKIYFGLNETRRNKDFISDQSLKLLEDFYCIHNQRLFDLLLSSNHDPDYFPWDLSSRTFQ